MWFSLQVQGRTLLSTHQMLFGNLAWVIRSGA